MPSKRQILAQRQGQFKLPPLDLVAVQKESWERFLAEGIAEALSEISPVEDFTGKNWALSLGEYYLGKPTITPLKAQEKGLTYSSPLKVEAKLFNKKTEKSTTQDVFLGDIPQMTDKGTFIINGIERVVVNQIVRSPGVYFSRDQDPVSARFLHRAEIRPVRGSWLEFEVGKNDVIMARIDRRRRIMVTILLRALGIATEAEILNLFADIDRDDKHRYIQATLDKDNTKSADEALLEIYRRMRPGEPVVLDTAKNFFTNLFFSYRRYDLSKVGRYKINKRLGLGLENVKENWILQKEDIVGTIRYLIGLQNNEGRIDDIDHLANRRVRRVGELVATYGFRMGLLRLERSVKEKMSLTSTDDLVAPSFFVNARPVIASLNEFFRSNPQSSILDQTNPLSEIDNLRRLTVTGPGGISRERASFPIRDINSSQYGRIDPIRSPEGPNIGLVTYMALYTRVNEYGFLEAPYRRVVKDKIRGEIRPRVTDEIVYLSADDEEEYHLTHAGVLVSESGLIEDDWVPMRYQGQFLEGPAELIDFMDMTPGQVVGTSASLIPFLAHDEANRALMGTHMQCQAVPLIKPAAAIVGTGMEEMVARSQNWVILAQNAGRVSYVDAQRIEIQLEEKVKEKITSDHLEIDEKREIHYLTVFKRTSQSTCYHQKPRVSVGDQVKRGDFLADGPATDNGEIALGQNMLIAYCSFEGLGYEDALVVSDRLVKEDVLTSIHIEEYEAEVVETKLGPEELTKDIPNVPETDLGLMDEDGIVVVGSEVGPNDILVGKIQPKGETELTSEERLLRAIFGEKAREVRDTSLRMPHGERGIVIGVSILDREKGDELEPGTLKKVVVRVAQIRKVTAGDKLAGRHGNKGVISKIVPAADMPYLPDGTPIDIIISPLSVLARMNLGQLLEAHLGWALDKKGEHGGIPVFEKVPFELISEKLKEARLPVSGKTRLINGKTGEPFEQETMVGVAYIMKLIHMVEDKMHARSTGPYSLVTQQPLGGKAQMGGQRLGEMEVWALEAHRAGHTLQEMLTIKSDDVVGRARAFEAIVKGTDIPESTIPDSFKVLMRELNALNLSVEPKGAVIATQTEPESGETTARAARELAEAAGASLEAEEGELTAAESPMEVEIKS
ncbi:DNA-directed RNA polymerase subunit beta [Candidatus Microgenomates bacterium]|nr:DNA-directed RNA polymerase subunit beta [Candidatus Microgenomates bacterium]